MLLGLPGGFVLRAERSREVPRLLWTVLLSQGTRALERLGPAELGLTALPDAAARLVRDARPAWPVLGSENGHQTDGISLYDPPSVLTFG